MSLVGDRQIRSVFVGNIPFEATEESLKDMFQKVGTVVNVRIVLDKEGRTKGYGFVEYSDPESAATAIRTLASETYCGRVLRLSAATGTGSDYHGQHQGPHPSHPAIQPLSSAQQDSSGLISAGPALNAPYGPPVTAERAPEEISRAVASLPPEQMFELMKQTKVCIQTNPQRARQMLLENPQLAYALLQAQIVMKILDPQVAMAMLHRETPALPTPVMPPQSDSASTAPAVQPSFMAPGPAPVQTGPPPPGAAPMYPIRPPVAGGPPGGPPPQFVGPFPRHPGPAPAPRPGFLGVDPNAPRPLPPHPGGGLLPAPGPPPASTALPVEQMKPSEPSTSVPQSAGGAAAIPPNTVSSQPGGQASEGSSNSSVSAEDQEKAMLIMQVLQLSDEQIARLPPEQRQSIMILKEQFSKDNQ